MTIYRLVLHPQDIKRDMDEFCGSTVQRWFHNKLLLLKRSSSDCLAGAKDHDEMVRQQERLRAFTEVLTLLHSNDSKAITDEFVVTEP